MEQTKQNLLQHTSSLNSIRNEFGHYKLSRLESFLNCIRYTYLDSEILIIADIKDSSPNKAPIIDLQSPGINFDHIEVVVGERSEIIRDWNAPDYNWGYKLR
jgi:hypothetical protein